MERSSVTSKGPARRLSRGVCVGAAFSVLVGILAILPRHAATGRTLHGWSLAVPSDTDSTAVKIPDILVPRMAVPSDTDSVAVQSGLLVPQRLDSLALRDTSLTSFALPADSDSVAIPDSFPLAERYLSSFDALRWTASPLPATRPFQPEAGSFWQHDALFNDSTGQYVTYEQVNGYDVRFPLVLDAERYRRLRLQTGIASNWEEIIIQRRQQQARAERRGGLGVNITVPGGRNSAFTTIFGKPQVDLRVNGNASIQAGFNRQQSDQQGAIYGGDGVQWDPTFNQTMNLGIIGTIGDKLHVNVDWDTQSEFDYQNRLKLDYTGYEDDIIQSIEAGNVYLKTPSSLIQGGQKLFGIKSMFQFGPINLTTVASQEKGQAQTLSVDGGATETEFELRPTDYDANRHFFLGYYFRNRYEDALGNPLYLQFADGFDGITKLEVWRLNTNPNPASDEQVRSIVAMVDLGEPKEIVIQSGNFEEEVLPGPQADQYEEAQLDQSVRPGDANPREYLLSLGLTSQDIKVGKFEKLTEQEYDFDENLGYISLNRSLRQDEALAVAFTFTAGGRTYQVGDFVTDASVGTGTRDEDALVLKLLQPDNVKAPGEEVGPAAWYLEMRNIYNIPASGVDPNRLEFAIEYAPPGSTPTAFLPDLGGQRKLLELLGLDRLNVNNATEPDGELDPIAGVTIDPGEGLIIFPYLEPFGERLAEVIRASGAPNEQELIDTYVFSNLYDQKQSLAKAEDNEHDVYLMSGTVRGRQSSFYDLGAFAGLVEGSVEITAGGQQLVEGRDFVVDYTAGTVNITNPAYTSANSNLQISYEQNSLFNFQQKTLLGARADLGWSEDFTLGATVMHLNEKSQVDKFRVGEEPISNLIWGFDGALQMESRWLTRMLDALPLVQTRAISSIQVQGEFARLQPGRSLTNAFDYTRGQLQDQNEDFYDDELRGVSYLDDFEGFENTFSLAGAGGWRLSSPPDSIAAVDQEGAAETLEARQQRSYWRALMGWYSINLRQVDELLDTAPQYTYPNGGHPVYQVLVDEIYPGRDVSQLTPQQRLLTTFDVYFDPKARGQYNYTKNFEEFFAGPKKTWGGITLSMPLGYTDFSVKNIEFLEFIFRPFSENAQNNAGEDAKLYINLGSISEDVVPDGEWNTEDGLGLTSLRESNLTKWGRLSGSTASNTLDYDEETQRTEDLGYDGLPSKISFPDDPQRYMGENGILFTEAAQFDSMLTAMDPNAFSSARYKAEIAKAFFDPSMDDYHHYREQGYFENPEYFPAHNGISAGATFQQRFAHFYGGQELNGFESQDNIAQNGVNRGVARYPDSEDLNDNYDTDVDNNYFQYALPLGADSLEARTQSDDPSDYVVGEIQNENGQGTGWYLIRIPIRDWTRRVGQINDFSTIESVRMWTTGHEVPVTLRFASFEIVGSRWRKSESIAVESADSTSAPSDDTRLSIASVNSEEDAGRYVKPDAVVQRQALGYATGARQQLREQAMVVRVENMKPGQLRGVYKNYTDGMDLLKYSNLRMYVHMHGKLQNGMTLNQLLQNASLSPEEVREKVKLFVRLGSNETGDYYQYVQPLTPSPSAAEDVAGEGEVDDVLWRTNQPVDGKLLDLNSMNIELAALNKLKVERDSRGVPLDSVFYHTQVPLLREEVARFAPPGTQLSIRGNPSLGRITTLVIGLMVADDSDLEAQVLKGSLSAVEMWINELRVSGYDQEPGWAAQASANIQLADLGYIRGNFFNETAGFGSLSSTLGSRDQINRLTWGVDARLNLDQLLPERFGWSIPLQFRYNTSNSTPIFAPSRGDVKVESLVDLVAQDTTITNEDERAELKQQIREASQTFDVGRSVNLSISKNNSGTSFLRNTLDNLRLSFNYSDQNARNPSRRKNNSWRWGADLNYRFDGTPFTLSPLWFLDGVPIIGFLGDLAWNLIPSSIEFGALADRSFSRSQNRLQLLRAENELPLPFAAPVNDRHSFDHKRNVDVQYNPFNFLSFSYNSNTDQSLHAAGVDTVSSLSVQDADGDLLQIYDHVTIDEALDRQLIDSLAVRQGRVTQIDSLRTVALGPALQRAFTLEDGLRTNTYRQNFVARLQSPFDQLEALDWIQLDDITYTTGYGWRNGPPGELTGAGLTNQSSVTTGLTIQPQAFWEQFGFYNSLAEASNAPADSNDSWLPSPLEILRDGFLMLTRIDAVNVSYRNNWNTTSSAVGQGVFEEGRLVDIETDYSLIDAFMGNGPPLAYRLGLQRRLGADYRVFGVAQVTDNLTNNHSVNASTSLRPIEGLNIQLNWNAGWSDNQNLSYGRSLSLTDSLTTNVHTGQNQVSIWSIGTSYADLFETQVEALQGDIAGLSSDSAPGPVPVYDENGDGRIALSNRTLMRDFQRAFTRGPGALGSNGLIPFPMPSWTVTYSGASNWPIFRSLTDGVTLRHGYFSSYSTGYRYETVSARARNAVDLGDYILQPLSSDITTNSISINETFNPLLEVNVRWKGDFQTNLSWRKTNAYQINGSRQIRESKTDDLTFTAGWQTQGLDIPLLSAILGRLDNTIRFNLSVSLSSNLIRSYQIRAALAEAAAVGLNQYDPLNALTGEANVTEARNTTRLSVSPKVTYRFSNRVSGSMFVNYNNLKSASGIVPSSNTIDGGFTVNVSIAN